MLVCTQSAINLQKLLLSVKHDAACSAPITYILGVGGAFQATCCFLQWSQVLDEMMGYQPRFGQRKKHPTRQIIHMLLYRPIAHRRSIPQLCQWSSSLTWGLLRPLLHVARDTSLTSPPPPKCCSQPLGRTWCKLSAWAVLNSQQCPLIAALPMHSLCSGGWPCMVVQQMSARLYSPVMAIHKRINMVPIS